MTPHASKKYWLLQFLGWGAFHLLLATQSFQAITTGQESLARVLILSPISYLACILGSHLLFLWNTYKGASGVPFKETWRILLSVISLIAVLMATLDWLILEFVGLYYPPPASRSQAIAALFNSFLLFILNFALVNALLLGLWWFCYSNISRRFTPPRPLPAKASEPVLDTESPVMITDGKQSKLITPSHIEYAFSEGNYVKLVGADLNMLVRGTLSHLESRLAQARFFRANRQTLVNLMKVRAIEEAASGNTLLTLESGKEVETSRRQGQLLREKLSL